MIDLSELDRMIEEREAYLSQALEDGMNYPLSDPDPAPVERASHELDQLYAERRELQG